MNRLQLDKLTVDGLRDIARSRGLDPTGTRAVLMERMVDVFEREGWPEQICAYAGESASLTGAGTCRPASGVSDVQNTSLINAENLQEIIGRAIQAYEETRARRGQAGTVIGVERPPGSASSTPVSQVSQNWQQIKFATKLIPPFAGRDEENVVQWLERISSVARMYSVPDESIVLAAVGQLKDRALCWYNRQSVESLFGWEEFKFQL